MASLAKKRKSSHLDSTILAGCSSSKAAHQITGVRNLVPWSSSDEWLEIQRRILDGSKDSIKLALSRLRVWELRCDSKKCPPFVEATIHLLRAFVADEDNSDTSEVLSVYGEAINKFVQTILERSAKPGEGLQNKIIAESLQIPQWIVDVRNDAIHHFRGSLPLYRTTANTVFDWLKQTYWAPDRRQKASEKQPAAIVVDGLVQEYLQLAVSAKSPAERSLANAALANLREISATTDRQSFVSHLVELESLTSIDKARSTSDIPTCYKNAYLPIFEMLEEDLTTLFVEVLKTLSLPNVVCSKRDVDHSMRVVFLWIMWLVSGDAIQDGNDLVSNLNFKKILQSAVTVVSTSTMDILEICFDRIDPPLSEKKIDFVRKLYVAFSGERARTCDGTNGFNNMTISTVENVVAERANRNKLNRHQLQSTPRVDWSVVPLGLLPDSVAVSDLYLDVDIEGDYVPFDVETEDDAVMKHERKFFEEQRQSQQIKTYNEDLYEDNRHTLADTGFKLWRIPSAQTMLDEQEESSYAYVRSHM